MGSTVYVTRRPIGGGNRRYHTEEDCPRLGKSNGFRGIDENQVFEDWDLCQVCAGEVEPPTNQSRAHLESLMEAANE